MNSKDLIIKAIEHESIARIPIDLGSTMISGLHISLIKKLRKYYGLQEKSIKLIEPQQMLGEIDDDLKKVIGIDTRGMTPYKNIFGMKNLMWQEWQLPDGQIIQVPEEFYTEKDNQNNIYIFPKGNNSVPPSAIMQATESSLNLIKRQEQIDEKEIKLKNNLHELKLISDNELNYLVHEASSISEAQRATIFTSKFTFLGNINYILAPYLEDPKGIRNLQDWYIAHIENPDYIKRIFAYQTKIALKNLAKINFRIGEYIDIILVCATDFGGQNSLFISPEIFRNLYKPFYKKINRWVHDNTGWKTMKHSCGAINDILEDIIDSGFDILNPLQFSALQTTPANLKKKWGDQITLWGNCIDTELLVSGDPEEIRKKAKDNSKILSQNGGYVFSPESLPQNTPIQNILALLQAIKK
ncbi:MAG: hypothetical protein K9M80_09770 [Candidatus Marinimicrobia bacterium]|nr:hypothetical protein [Candidatus Neomarinimicrobiota bacterium]